MLSPFLLMIRSSVRSRSSVKVKVKVKVKCQGQGQVCGLTHVLAHVRVVPDLNFLRTP